MPLRLGREAPRFLEVGRLPYGTLCANQPSLRPTEPPGASQCSPEGLGVPQPSAVSCPPTPRIPQLPPCGTLHAQGCPNWGCAPWEAGLRGEVGAQIVASAIPRGPLLCNSWQLSSNSCAARGQLLATPGAAPGQLLGRFWAGPWQLLDKSWAAPWHFLAAQLLAAPGQLLATAAYVLGSA